MRRKMEDSRISETKKGQHRKQKQEEINKGNIQRKMKIYFLQFQTIGQEIIQRRVKRKRFLTSLSPCLGIHIDILEQAKTSANCKHQSIVAMFPETVFNFS